MFDPDFWYFNTPEDTALQVYGPTGIASSPSSEGNFLSSCGIGTYTGDIIINSCGIYTGSITANNFYVRNNLYLDGFLFDQNGQSGLPGQILVSDITGIRWESAGIGSTGSDFTLYAVSAGTANYAITAGYAFSSGISTYSSFSGIATFAGISTYSSFSGIATYSSFSGIATNLLGGIASQIPYQSAPNTTAYIPNGTENQVLQSNGTSPPSWSSNLNVGIVSATQFRGGTFFGDGSGMIGITGTGSGIVIYDNGEIVGTAATINFGDKLTISPISAGICTITAQGATNEFPVLNPAATGVFAGGIVGSVFLDTISYIDISTLGNSLFYGSLAINLYLHSSCSSSTLGFFGGGASNEIFNSVIESPHILYKNIVTSGDAYSFGELSVTRAGLAACSSSTRGVFGGGYYVSDYSNTIDYITFSTQSNATDFGDLTIARVFPAACSSPTRGVFGGGFDLFDPTNTIDYITVASTGNATDFGDLTVARGYLAACSSSTRGVFGGGYNAIDYLNTIDYITIASTGNATDFGDLANSPSSLAACSTSHGGL